MGNTLQSMISQDIKQWALDNNIGHGSDHKIIDYRDVVDAYAEAQGWTQPGFTGFEIIQ